MNYLRLLRKTFALEIASEMAYKLEFFILCLSLILADMVGPLIVLLIYTTTTGVPGWGFEEFILLTGTFVLVMGITHLFLARIAYGTVENIRRGKFDKILMKPANPLLYITFSSVDLEGVAEVFVGVVLIGWSIAKLNINMISSEFLVYIFLIIAALLFVYSMFVLVTSFVFLFVKTYAVIDLFYKSSDFAKYPIIIYGSGFRFFLTFLFPIMIVSNYPAEALLKGFDFIFLIKIITPVIVFFMIALVFWHFGIRKYSSAGG